MEMETMKEPPANTASIEEIQQVILYSNYRSCCSDVGLIVLNLILYDDAYSIHRGDE